jgi:hypothetical protein
MPPDWNQLRHETAAAQLTFLDAEVDTGITLARIALKANDQDKLSRNAVSARKAYDTIRSYIADLPPQTRGLEDIRKKMATLEGLLRKLEGDR